MAINKYDAEIIFRDNLNLKGKTVIKEIPVASTPTLVKLLAYATSLKTYSNAAVHSYSLLGWEEATVTDATVPSGLNTVKAIVNCEYVVSGVRKYRNIFLPNPSQTAMEEVVGQGIRLTQDALDDISAALSTASGITITATEGKLVVKSWKKDSSPRGICVVFKDEEQHNSYMTLPSEFCTTAAALATFAAALVTAAVSASRIISCFFLTKQEAVVTPGEGIGEAISDEDNIQFSPVESRMWAKMSYVESSKKHTQSLVIPAMRNAAVATSGDSWAIPPLTGADIATALGTFTGRTYTYKGSKFKNKNLVPQG